MDFLPLQVKSSKGAAPRGWIQPTDHPTTGVFHRQMSSRGWESHRSLTQEKMMKTWINMGIIMGPCPLVMENTTGKPWENDGFWWNFMRFTGSLWQTNVAIEHCHRNSWFSHQKRWFSIVMWLFTRGWTIYRLGQNISTIKRYDEMCADEHCSLINDEYFWGTHG